MLVGTAITGQSTRPPITLGRAPSIPATTTRTSAPWRSGSRLNRRWIPATPMSATRSTSQFQVSAETRASSATGQVAGPGGDDHHPAELRPEARPWRTRKVRPAGCTRPRGNSRGAAPRPRRRPGSPGRRCRGGGASGGSRRSARSSCPGRRSPRATRSGPPGGGRPWRTPRSLRAGPSPPASRPRSARPRPAGRPRTAAASRANPSMLPERPAPGAPPGPGSRNAHGCNPKPPPAATLDALPRPRPVVLCSLHRWTWCRAAGRG